MLKGFLSTFILLFLFSCGEEQGGARQNNLISLPQDDTANAKANGDAHIVAIEIADDHYSYKEPMFIDVTFSQWIVVKSGTPKMKLDVGGATAYAEYISGSGTAKLRFKYLPEIGEYDDDGIEVVPPWDFNDAEIEDRIGQLPQLSFDSFYFPGAIVDVDPPVTTFDSLSSIVYANFENYSVSGTCTDKGQDVDVVIGGVSKTTTCNNSNRYSVSMDLTAVAESADNTVADVEIYANHYDYAGNITKSTSQFVIKDTIRPFVIANANSNTGTRVVGDTLDFTVSFNEDVVGSGSRLHLKFSDSEKNSGATFANYQGGSGSSVLSYRYTVPSGYSGNGDEDNDGIELYSNLDLNGNTLRDVNGNEAIVALSTLSFSGVFVDGIQPRIVSITSPSKTYNTYYIGQTISFTVTFDDNVSITGANPYLRMAVYNDQVTGSRDVTYVSGDGGNSFVFNHTFISGNKDSNGIQLEGNLLSNNLQDANGNAALSTLSHTNFTSLFIDAVVPTVSLNTPADIIIANANSYPISGNCSEYLHSEVVSIVVTDRLGGSVSKNVTCTSGTYTTTMNLSTLADSATPTTSDLTIAVDHTDRGGVSATTASGSMLKDTVAPYITSNTSVNSGTRICGQNINFDVNFNEVVSGANSSRIKLTFSDSEQNAGNTFANYQSGDNSNRYRFRYTIPNGYIGNGDEDTDGVDHASSIDLQGGSIVDLNGNPLASTTLSSTHWASLNIDGIKPVITNVSTPAPSYNTYYIGQTMPVSVVYDDIVNVSGANPYIRFQTFNVNWTSSPQLDYSSGSGSNTLVFSHTFFNGNQDNNGLNLNSNIQTNNVFDANGNRAYNSLTTTSFPSILVDALVPVVTASTLPDINIANVNAITLSGTCSEYLYSETVDVTVTDRNSNTLTYNIPCSGGSFSQTVDLSSLIDSLTPTTSDISFVFNHSDRGGNNAPQVVQNKRKDTVAPYFVSNTLQTLSDIYIIGETINILVNYNEVVSSTGGSIALSFETETGASPVANFFSSSNNSNQHSYRYTVIANEEDTNGITLSSNLNGVTITDVNGNSSSPITLTTLSFPNATVDGIIPVVSINAVSTVNEDNVTSYSISGSCTSGDNNIDFTIASPSGGTPVTGSVSCSGGSWTSGPLNLSSVADNAAITFNAQQADAGGNIGYASTLTALKDTADPIVVVNSPVTINSYNYTSYSFSGTCTNGDGSVSYTIHSPSGGSDVTGTSACSGGAWNVSSLNLSSLSDDLAVTFNATQTDSAGNIGSASQVTALKDIVLPVVSLNAVSTVNNSNVSSYSISGTCTDGDGNISYTISSPSGGVDVSSNVSCSSGTWSSGVVDISSVADNAAITFDATQTDTAGNIGAATQRSAVKDTLDPILVITNPGVINSYNSGSYSFSGSCTNGDGAVSYTIHSPSGGADITGSTSCNGSFSVSGLDLSSLNNDSAISFDATQTDSYGNMGAASQKTALKDVVLPVVSINSVVTINNSNVSNYSISGTCTDGDGNTTYTISSPAGGSVSNSVSCSGGLWTSGSISLVSLNDHAGVTFDASQTDSAANLGASAQLTAIKDTQAPVVTINPVSTINMSNVTSYSISGTCIDGDGLVSYTIHSPSGGGDIVGTTTCSIGNWSLSPLDLSSLSDDLAVSFDASQTDSNGNLGSASQRNALKDTSAPVLSINSPVTINSSNMASYSFSGTCTSGDGNISYTIHSPGGGSDVTGSTACSGSAWSVSAIDLSGLSDHATITFDASQTDVALNTGNASQVSALKDTNDPIVTINAVSTINISNESNYSISGTCTVGDGNVTYTIHSPSGGSDVSGNVICNVGGVWSATSLNLAGLNDDLLISFNASQTDSNANVGTATQLTAVKDTLAPAVSINNPTIINNGNYTSYNVNGTCTSGDGNVTYTIHSPAGGSDITGSVSCNSNTWSAPSQNLSGLSDHTSITFDASQTDNNGNLGSATQKAVLKDTVLPVVTINPVGLINIGNVSNYSLSGTCTSGDGNISYTIHSPGGGSDITGTSSCSGTTWSLAGLDLSGLNDDAAISFDVSQTDSAGNIGNASQRTTSKDTQAPVVTINAVTVISLSNQSSYSFGGSCSSSDGSVSYVVHSPSGGSDVTGSVSCSSSTWSVSGLNLSGLSDDSAVSFNASQTDGQGNTGNASEQTTLKDTIAPVVAINPVSTINLSNYLSYSFSGSCTNTDGSVSYTIHSPSGGADITGLATCSGGSWTTTNLNLSTLNDDGAVSFNASQTDGAGNSAAATQLTATKDTVAPVVTINALSVISSLNQSSYSISGTCTSTDGNVSYVVHSPSGGSDVAGTVACSSSSWSATGLNLSGLVDDTSISFDASQTDSQGNLGSATQLTIQKDTAPPVLSITSPSVINQSNVTSYSLGGGCTDGDGNVSYTIHSPSGGSDVSGSVACSSSAWSATALNLSGLVDDGAITFNATQTDSAGNSGVASQLTTIKDTSAPIVSFNAVAGISLANVSAYSISGSCSSGDGNVSYSIHSPSGGSDVTGSVACSSSSWSATNLNLSGLNDDIALTFNATQTDGAGNTGAAGQLTAVKDTTAPVLSINAVSTISSLNVSSYSISGTCSNGDGNVSYIIHSPSGGSNVTGSVACSSSTWSASALNLSGLSDDIAVTFNATQTDSAGNTGAAAQMTAVKDTTAPVLSISAVSTISSSNESSYSISGSCSSGDGNVSYAIHSPSGGSDVTGSVVCSSSTWSASALNLSGLFDDSAVTFNATQTDSAGNIGAATQVTAIKDATAPVVSISAVSTISSSNESSYSISGSCSSGDGNVSYTIHSPSGGSDVTGSVSCSSSTWSASALNLSGLSDDSAVTFNATQTDSAGNTGTATQITIIKDTISPVLSINAVSTISSSNASSYAISGNCSSGDENVSYVIHSPSGGSDVTGSVACSSSTWSISALNLSGLSDDSAVTFNATQTDSAGNTGGATQMTAVKDTAAPVLSISAVSTISSSNESSYSISGSCSTGDGNVSYTIHSPSGGSDVTGNVSCSSSTWSANALNLSGLSDDSTVTFNATQTDSAGNTGAATQLTAIKDTAVPLVSINIPSTVNSINYAAYAVTGTCSNGDGNVSYTIHSPSGVSDVTGAVACSGGSWSSGGISLAGLNDDSGITFDASQTDSFGNIGSAVQRLAIKDIIAPSLSINSLSIISISNSSSYSFSGSCSLSDGDVSYSIHSPSGGSDISGTATCGGGSWSVSALTMSGLNDDVAIEFDASQTDSAGNLGTAAQLTVLKDTIAPIVSINSTVTIYTGNETAYLVSGSCEDSEGSVSYLIHSPSGGSDISGTTSCSGSAWSDTVNLAGLSDDSAIEFNATQTDAVSNIGTATQKTALKESVLPFITSVTTTATGRYDNGDTIDFVVNFSETVNITSGTRLVLNVGGASMYANCQSASATSTTCTYVVGSEVDDDGINLNSSLDLNTGTIMDLNGNSISNLSFSAPDLSDVLINSDGIPDFEWEESSSVISSYDYGDPGTNVTVSFTVKNIGSGPTTASFNVSITDTASGVYSLVTDNCSGFVIAKNDSCTVHIQYLDIDPAGLKTGTATATDTGVADVDLTLEGTR
ncbi:MAG: hypothetical protein VYA54_09375 [Bdellovibrionota bacterium]|nr:hypothetical protein [Bdellovibrionota bacterium]